MITYVYLPTQDNPQGFIGCYPTITDKIGTRREIKIVNDSNSQIIKIYQYNEVNEVRFKP